MIVIKINKVPLVLHPRPLVWADGRESGIFMVCFKW